MSLQLSPTREGELLVRIALAIGLALTGVAVWATLPSPPDYGLPPLTDPDAVDDVAELMGADVVDNGGIWVRPSITNHDLATGDEVLTALAYSDEPLAVPDTHTVIVDTMHECIRIVVSTDGPTPPEDALATYVQHRRDELRTWLAEAPRDPCLGRPPQP